MTKQGFVVPRRKKAEIYALAKQVREFFQQIVKPTGYFPVDKVYTILQSGRIPGFDFEFEVLESHEMGDNHGQTFPDRKLIYLRNDVYEGMCLGKGRDRFTGAHELGHLLMHTDIPFARALDDSTLTICNSEWQANTFASALLIDDELLGRCRSVQEVSERFGVTVDAARVRYQQ